MTLTLGELATLVGGRLEGAAQETPVEGVASAASAGSREITFFSNPRYLPALLRSKAAAALVPEGFSEPIPAARIFVENPSTAFAQVAAIFAPPEIVYEPGAHPSAVIAPGAVVHPEASIGPCAVIEPGATIGARTRIGAGTYVGHETSIGEDCLIYPNVTIRERTKIGNRVILQPGCILGSDGFGFEFVEGRHRKIPQIGIVQIDDDVEVGANVTIDRARFGRTWIQEGTKIDNLVQIAHNVTIGKHSIIVSQVGISGSTELGNYVTLAGQVGLAGHIRLGDRVTVGAKSGVSKDIPAGETWFGFVAVPLRESKELLAMSKRLPKYIERIKHLEDQLEKLIGKKER